MFDEMQRILMGEQDLRFALEVLFRTTIVYFYTLMLMRWLGGRTVAQLSIVEFLLVIAIGSAVGDSLFYPEVPMLPAMFAILIVSIYNKLIDKAMLASPWFCRVFEGRPRIVVSQGRVHADRLRRQGIGVQELYSKLRQCGIEDLAQVKFAILEADGGISILKHGEHGGEGLYQPPMLPAREMAWAERR